MEKAERGHKIMATMTSEDTATEESEDNVADSKETIKEKEEHQDSSDEQHEQVDFSTGISNEKKSVLMTVFMENINSGHVLTIADIRMEMRSVPFLRCFVLDKAKMKKFYDFVRHKTNVVCETSDALYNEDDFDFVNSLSSSQRKAWEAHY